MKSKRRTQDAMFHATSREKETSREREKRQQKDWRNKHYTDRYEKFKAHHWSLAIKSEGKSERKGEAYYQRACIYKQKEKFQWALDDFKQAKRLLPKDAQSYKWASSNIIQLERDGKFKNFEEPDGESSKLDVDDAIAKREKEILENFNKSPIPEESFQDLFKAIVNIKNLGNKAMNDGDQEKAYQHYQQATFHFDKLGLEFIDRFEENGYTKDQRKIQTMIYSAENACRLRLVVMNLEKKRYLQAMDDALYVCGSKDTIKQTNLKRSEYLLSLCFYNLNLLTEAESHINFAEEEIPDDKDVFDLKCKIEDSLVKSHETIQECTKILRGEKGNIKILLTRAKCYFHIGYWDEYKKSFHDFQHILQLNPRHKEALKWIIKIKDRLKELKIDVPEIEAYDPYQIDTSSTDEDTEISEEEDEESENDNPENEFFEVVMYHLKEKFPTASSEKLDFYYDKTLSTHYDDDQFVRASEVIAKVTEVLTEAEEAGFSDFEWYTVTEEVLKKYPDKDISDLEEHIDTMKANYKPPLNQANVISELTKLYQEEIDRLQNENYSMNHFAKAVVASMKEDDVDKYGSTKTFKLVFLELQKDYPFRSRLEVWICFKELWTALTRETYSKLLLTKFVELCKRVFELQDEAWKERVQPLKEKKEDALIIENVVDHVKHFHPHVPNDEIKARTEHVIALKRREKKCGDDLESRIKQIVQLPFESRPSLSPSQWAHLL